MRRTRPLKKSARLRIQTAAESGGPELEERIRQKARELYEKRGRVEGYALQDWLEAERMVKDEQTTAGG